MKRKKRRFRYHRGHRRDKGLRALVAIAFLVVITIFGAGYLKNRYAADRGQKKTTEAKGNTGVKENQTDENQTDDMLTDGKGSSDGQDASSAETSAKEGSFISKTAGVETVWNGKSYELRNKQDLVLFLGVDRSDEAAAGYEDAGQNGIAETLLVLVADREKKEVTLLDIPADTMVQAQLYDASGNASGEAGKPVGLQFSYGKSARDGCRLTEDRVSEVLLGQNIDGTISLTVDGLKEVVDSVGGVDVLIPEDMTGMESVDPSFIAGKTVHMDGALAVRFVTEGNGTDVNRDADGNDLNESGGTAGNGLNESGGAAAGRKQIALLKALYHKSDSGLNVAQFLNQAAQRELYSGVDLDTLVNLFACSVKEEVLELPGERTGEGSSSEFRTDEEKMEELVIGLFYEEVQEGTDRRP